VVEFVRTEPASRSQAVRRCGRRRRRSPRLDRRDRRV